jgi:glutathione S-transferase
MHWVAVITVLALVEYLIFQGMTGAARGKADLPAPKVVGDEHYERWYRVQMNTLEQLIIFLPALWLCGHFGATTVAAVAGGVFVVARAIYAASYIQDPKKRTLGFVLGYLANLVLLVRAGWSAIMLVM